MVHYQNHCHYLDNFLYDPSRCGPDVTITLSVLNFFVNHIKYKFIFKTWNLTFEDTFVFTSY